MVDYTNELRRLRDMHDNFLIRYGTRLDHRITDTEIKYAREIKKEIGKLWNLAVETSCRDSENELVELESTLERLATKRRYSL